YLSRADFDGTFPAAKKAARARAANVAALGQNWSTDKSNSTTAPAQGQSGSLRLVESNEYNEDLVFALGSDYDDEQWDALLNQISAADLAKLVAYAGYKTEAVASVGKPLCTDLDGPSGLNSTNMSSVDSSWTCFPVETVLASAWNPRLSYTYGLAVGAEAAVTKISGWYAPAMNIHRSPFDGRNFEYYSEDPYLSGVMGAETTRGAVANGLYCYIKHFAVNESETGRSGLYTWLTEQAMREIYLRPFEISVKRGGANAVMSSFNRIGGVWAGGNYALCTTVLRDEWGFKGTVLTDYSTGGDYMNVDQGLRAGGDAWLNPNQTGGTINGFNDRTSATALTCMRRAAKNILYTYCNTIYTAKTHDSTDDKYVAEVGVKTLERPRAYWWFGIAAIDLVGLGGCGVWTYFLLRKKKGA
ncbi:MAG: hypothetical protein LBS99_04340, partial [Clostridiales bacterium]|nr:hypothetical protein [Clostridiales bacterium]